MTTTEKQSGTMNGVGGVTKEFDGHHFEDLIDKVRSAYYGSESEIDFLFIFRKLKVILKAFGKCP